MERGGDISEARPIEVALELVVEILPDSETERSMEDKLAVYISIGVKEAWLVRPDARTVEVLRLTSEGPETSSVYNQAQILQSVVFPDLTLLVADCFR